GTLLAVAPTAMAVIPDNPTTAPAIPTLALRPQLPPRPPAICSDAALRFPVQPGFSGSAIDDPRWAVGQALRALGYHPDSNSPFTNFLLDRAVAFVTSWVAGSLLSESHGVQAPTLAAWLKTDALNYRITPEERAAMQSWPPDSCEGAFMWNPANAGIVGPMS